LADINLSLNEEKIVQYMHNPIATYRIQFNKSFTFQDLKSQLSYLAELGIGAVYASPIFEAAPGSEHGYDVANPLKINPEIGTPDEWEDIAQKIQGLEMGWVQDWVPNHMAYHLKNPWIFDILEKGPQSPYATYFDIDWKHPDFGGKLMVPFLGDEPDAVVERGELKLDYREGRFVFAYFDNLYPLSVASIAHLLKFQQEEAPPELADWLGKYIGGKKQGKSDQETQMSEARDTLNKLYQSHDTTKKHVSILLEVFNRDKERLHTLLELQHYCLSYWKITEKSINFRRFFTINDLICLNMQRPEVFDAYHAYLRQLLEKGQIQGLRIDHIDGMYDPTGYFAQLREMAGAEAYLVVEKILEAEEELPAEWPLQGNTGYDFLVMVNNLFTYQKNYPKLLKFYQKLTGIREHPEEIIYKKKKLQEILQDKIVGI